MILPAADTTSTPRRARAAARGVVYLRVQSGVSRNARPSQPRSQGRPQGHLVRPTPHSPMIRNLPRTLRRNRSRRRVLRHRRTPSSTIGLHHATSNPRTPRLRRTSQLRTRSCRPLRSGRARLLTRRCRRATRPTTRGRRYRHRLLGAPNPADRRRLPPGARAGRYRLRDPSRAQSLRRSAPSSFPVKRYGGPYPAHRRPLLRVGRRRAVPNDLVGSSPARRRDCPRVGRNSRRRNRVGRGRRNGTGARPG